MRQPISRAPTPAQVEQLKRDAKRLKKAKGITHSEALDEIAREIGLANWSSFMRAHNAGGKRD